MAAEDEQPRAAQPTEPSPEKTAVTENNLENGSTGRASSEEKKVSAEGYLPQSEADYVLTWKTWTVVWILAWSYGISFWIVPSASAAQAVMATQLGDVTKQAWYVPVYTITVTIAFMICGANSDLFGRRWFIIGGNVIMFIGL